MGCSAGVIGLGGKFEVGFENATRLMCKTVNAMRSAGINTEDSGIVMCDRESAEKASVWLKGRDLDALIVCVATWSEDHHLLDLLHSFKGVLLLHAYPAFDTGSLCGVHQICAVLTDIGFTDYRYIYGEAGASDVIDEIKKIVCEISLDKTMRIALIGSVGGRVSGMTEIACDELAIRAKLGARIVPISMAELEYGAAAVSDTEAKAEWQRHAAAFTGEIKSDAAAITDSMRYYLAMKKLIEKYGLSGLSVSCYPDNMGKVCLGYSLLSEEGYVCGCEGDAPNTVAMLLMRELSGGCVHNTDLLYPDVEKNTILFSHCGSGGCSLACDSSLVTLAPVRLAECGVCVMFPAKTGKVTLIDLTGHGELLRISSLCGDAVETGMEFPGDPLKIRFERSVLDICRDIAEKGCGHHWMAAYGDLRGELEGFCKRHGVRCVSL